MNSSHIATRILALAVAGLLTGWLTALPARAQGAGSPQCVALEQELTNLSINRSGNGPQIQRIERAMSRQRQALDATARQGARLGCDRRGFLIFQPRRPRECTRIDASMNEMENNLAGLERQRSDLLGHGRPDPVRDRILASLGRFQCGPQYRRYAPRSRARLRLFEDPNSERLRRPLYGQEGQRMLGDIPSYRTLCVRTCDGFYFPVSFATLPSRFGEDAGKCSAQCPTADVQLYVYPNPGGTAEQMSSMTGEPYSSLENAWRFRNEVVRGCTCNPNTLQLEAYDAEQKAREIEEAMISGNPAADGNVRVSVVAAPEGSTLEGLPIRDLDRDSPRDMAARIAAKSGVSAEGELLKAHVNSRYDLRSDDPTKDFSNLGIATGTKDGIGINRNASAGTDTSG